MTDLRVSRAPATNGHGGAAALSPEDVSSRVRPSILSTPIVLGLIGGLVATLFFYWLAVEGSAVPTQPHHVPVVVVGPPSEVAHLAPSLEHGGAFTVLTAPSENQAVRLVQHRNADAIVNLYTRDLQTAPAASTLTPIVLEQVFSSPGAPIRLREYPVVPLAPGDPNGMGLMLFLPLGSVLGGLPSGLALAMLTKPRRPRNVIDAGWRMLLMIASSAAIALGLALLADWILGYGGTQMLTIWGWSTLLVVACAACAEVFVAAFGIAGILLAAIPILFFGIPSAPWPVPWNWQSGVFRILGPFDPVGATSDGVRNGIFFGLADQTKDLVVMGVWIVVPVLLMLALGLWNQLGQQERRAFAAG